jgi:hypothetical protein
MHENVKDILLPLRLLRKGGYRLFSYEERIKKNIDLNMFKDKEQLKAFINGITEDMKGDEILQAKTNTPEELDQIMAREKLAQNMRYSYNEEKLKEPKVDNKQNPYDSIALKSTGVKPKKASEISKKNYELQQKALREKEEKKIRGLIFPNIERLKHLEELTFEKQALIADFEKGFKAMLVYLNKKFPNQVQDIIDPHKLTVNLENISRTKPETNFFMSQLDKALYDLKKMCYEMKLNGLNRILLPITANIEFTTQVKIVYDLHCLIDKIMGDKLKLEQYSFIYHEIEFITKSNFHEELYFFKDKNFIEVGLSKFLFYQALCHSVEVLENIRKNNRLHNVKYDLTDNYFQTTKLNLDSIDEFNSLNFYNFNNYTPEVYNSYSTDLKNKIINDKEILIKEIADIGRFFIFENFIEPDQRDNWIELTNQLIEINKATREDIRDHLLRSSSNRIVEGMALGTESKHQSKNPSRSTSRRNTGMVAKITVTNTKKKKRDSKQSSKESSTNKLTKVAPTKKAEKKKKIERENSIRSGISGDSSKNLIILKDVNISKLKPPIVWNFPIDRIREIQNITRGRIKYEEKE